MLISNISWASEVARWGKTFAAKPDFLGLIPWTHMVKGEN